MKKKTIIILATIACLLGGTYYYLSRPLAPDDRSGDRCPQCGSTDVGKYFYGLYEPDGRDTVLNDDIAKGRLIPGGCMIDESSPRYRCNNCSYRWGNHVTEIKESFGE